MICGSHQPMKVVESILSFSRRFSCTVSCQNSICKEGLSMLKNTIHSLSNAIMMMCKREHFFRSPNFDHGHIAA